MKRNTFFIIMTLAAGLLFSGCAKELDIPKKGNLGAEEDFYKTDEDAESAITMCYSDMGAGLYEELRTIDNLLSDDIWCGGGSKNDNAQREDIGAYVHSSTNELIQSMFEHLYTLIYHSNLVIEKFDSYDSDIKKRALAEAYFFRGFAHFYLGAFFGTAPIVDHLLETDEYAQGNSTREGLYGQAISDFSKALEGNNLTAKSLGDRGVRVTPETVKSFLGKAYVFNEDFSSAVRVLDEVISSGKYALYGGAYGDLQHAAADYCAEYVFERNIVQDWSNPWSNLTTAFVYYGIRDEMYDMSGLQANLSGGGYGFFNPTKSLYDAFVAEEGENGYRLGESVKTYPQMKANGVTILEGKTLHGHEGYWNWKNRLLTSDWYIFQMIPTPNLVYMRYAEVLLLAAEAHVRGGDPGKAAEYLNRVRSRASLPAKGSISLADVKTEKRLELCFEGCRWMDLVRWGDAATVLGDKGKSIKGFNGTAAIEEYTNSGSKGFVAGKHEVLPIPDLEIKLNSSLTQNPQW